MLNYAEPSSDMLDCVKEPNDVLVVTDGGPWAKHNMPCPVCQDNHAVLNMNTGVFGPCRVCEKDGWKITKHLSLWQRFNNLLRNI
jgi:hypothetical protein